MKSTILIITTLLVISSCALNYNIINPKSINYPNRQLITGVDFAYKYNVLNERGNTKYAKKESQKGIKIVAVKVVNNTDSSFIFGTDYKVYKGDSTVALLEPEFLQKQFQQNVPIHLLYFLLTPLKIHTTVSKIPIGYAVGPSLAIGNMLQAGRANKNFKNEIVANYLNGRQINAGETVYSLIGIHDQGFNPLTLK